MGEGTPALEAEDELAGEAVATASSAAGATSSALRALSRSARAFALYEPTNEAVRRFLGEFRDKSRAALELCGELALEVRPFELTFQGEVVYLERDRERSLAFRLFRDGVRRLTLRAGVTWEELLRLLEILSVRFAGVRQQEDDVVTLLTKASFQFITFEAVEGFVAQSDDEGSGAVAVAASESAPVPGRVAHVESPAVFDQPLPAVGAPRTFAYRAIPEKYRTALQTEEGVETLPANSVRMAKVLLELARAGSGAPPPEILSAIAEVRDFLVGERRLATLLELVDALLAAPPPLPSLLDALGTAEMLPRLLDAIEGEQAPPELDQLLSRVPGDHVLHLLQRLSALTVQRPAVIALLRPRLNAAADQVLAQLPQLPPEVLGDVVSVLVEVAPPLGLPVARILLELKDPEALYQAAEVLARLPQGDDVTALLSRILDNPAEPTRIRAIQVMGRRQELRTFNQLSEWMNGRLERLSVAEAQALCEALAQISPRTALSHMSGWLKPQASLLRRLVETPGQKRLKRAAVPVLAALPLPEVDEVLKDFKDRADDELRPVVLAALARRRRGGTASG